VQLPWPKFLLLSRERLILSRDNIVSYSRNLNNWTMWCVAGMPLSGKTGRNLSKRWDA